MGGMTVLDSSRPLLTLPEAAAAVGCSARTLRRAIESGELEARRIGAHGHFRVAPEAVERMLVRTGPERKP